MAKRTAGNALPDPPNPAPAPFSGPPPTTGSGRTAHFVPTFVGPNADAEWDEVTAHAAVGGATLEAPAMDDAFAMASEELTVPRGGPAAGTRRNVQPLADPMAGPDAPAYGSVAGAEVEDDVSPYSPTVQYADDEQAAWDEQAMAEAGVPVTQEPGAGSRGRGASSLRPPSTMRGPRSSRASAVAARSGRASGVRTGEGGKKPRNPMVVAAVVIVVIAAVGAGAYFGLVAPGTSGGNNATANTDDVNIDITPSNDDTGSNGGPSTNNGTNGGNGGTNDWVCEWKSTPRNVTVTRNADGDPIWLTREDEVRATLTVRAPREVVRVTLDEEEIATPEAKEFELEVVVAQDIDENQKLRFETKNGPPFEFDFILAFDNELPSVKLMRPVVPPDRPLITAERRLPVQIRVTDDFLLRQVTIRAAGRVETMPVEEGEITATIEQEIEFPRDGDYVIEVTADDMAGNSRRFQKQVVVDSRPPEVRFDGQAADARQWEVGEDRVVLTGTVEDPGGRPTGLTIDGTNVPLSPAGADGATFRWQSRRLQPGGNRFEVVATDHAENVERFSFTLDFSPDRPPEFVQLDLGGIKVWSRERPGETPPGSFQYQGGGEQAQIELFFDAFSRPDPEVTVNGDPVEYLEGDGSQWQCEHELPFTGEETDVEIIVRTSVGTEATMRFTILRTPWPGPVMPLYRMDGVDLQRAFPPSGNTELDPDSLAVDFAPGRDGSVAVLTTDGHLIDYTADGEENWSEQLPDGARPDSLRRAGDLLVVRTAGGRLLVYDATDGRFLRPGGVLSLPGSDWCAVDERRVAVQAADGAVIVVDLVVGDPLVFPAPGRPSGPLVAIAGRYLLLGRGGVTALSLTLRRPVWSSPEPVTDIEVGPDGTVVLAEASGRVRAIKGFGSGNELAVHEGDFVEGPQVALWSGGLVAVGHAAPAADDDGADDDGADDGTGDGDGEGEGSDGADASQWVWVWHRGEPNGPATALAGVLPESLRSGPDGSLWCMTAGYVCRITLAEPE